MTAPLRIGALGAARITPDALLRPAQRIPEVEVVAIAARDPARAQRVATRYKIPRLHTTYADLVADPELDAIYNPLPNSLHCEWTLRALEAGKHVLCEKPLAANAVEAVQMAETATTHGLVLMEAFHNLYHPLLMRVKEIINSGELGTLRHVEAHFCTIMWRWWDIRWDYGLAGGATMDVGAYAIRLLRFFTGAEPEVVRAQAHCIAPQIDRYMAAEFRFLNNVTGAMTCAFLARSLVRVSARVMGEAGELHVLNPILPHLFHRLQVRTPAGVRTEHFPGESTYTYQLRAFAQAIRGETTLPTTGADGVANMRVIDAVYRAAGLRPRGQLENKDFN